jgi:hypothetical protein
MPKFNELIQPDRKQINWLNSNFKNGTIFVDNSFQRRSVWVLKNKIRLIETILKGFPMPEIYLWAGLSNPETGDATYSIVDGQQRLTAIRDYIGGTFSLDSKVLDDQPPNAHYRNKSFDELSPEEKQSIWEYYITTRVVPSTIKREEIVEIFLRLNETDKSLNPQELRNAEFNGLFIKNVERIANLKFWQKYRVFNSAAIRRMGDLQFISSLLMFLRSGIEAEVSQESINSMYDTYNDNYPDAGADRKTAKSVISEIDILFRKSATATKFFRSQVHLYPLFIVVYQQKAQRKAISANKWVERMEAFAKSYLADRKPALVDRYRAAATEGTQKRSNREDRVRYLREWIISR